MFFSIFLFFVLTKKNYIIENVFNRNKVYLITFGNISKSEIETSQRVIYNLYGKKVIVYGETNTFDSVKIFNNCVDASDMLDKVNKKYEHLRCRKLLLTDLNICKNSKSILGIARINGNSCLVSTNKVKFKNTLPKTVSHEIGHTLGLRHCNTSKCVMLSAKNKKYSVHSEPWLCDECRNKLHLNDKL